MYRRKKSLRLKGWDYSDDGWYFVTIYVQKGVCIFGDIADGNLRLNNAGKMVCNVWKELPKMFPKIQIDEFIIMPNHMHGIIAICKDVGVPLVGTRNEEHGSFQSICSIIAAYKSITTNEYIRNVKEKKWYPFDKKIWQRSFYDHIVRNEADLYRIRNYIRNNPRNWKYSKSIC